MDRDRQEWRPREWTMAQVLSPSVSAPDLLESGRVPLSLESIFPSYPWVMTWPGPLPHRLLELKKLSKVVKCIICFLIRTGEWHGSSHLLCKD